MIKTTVVIPNYNGIKYIEDCLSSLKKSSVELKIIVVDNGSSDGSRQLVEEKFPEVRLICFEENTGFCKAVNTGIMASETEYVMLLNNDTVAEERMAECLEDALGENPKLFSAAAKMINMYEPDKIDSAGDFYSALGWAYARGKDKPVDKYSIQDKVFSACAGAALYRRKVFETIGYFDENHFAYLEDMDIGYRANIYGFKNIYVPDAHVFHAGSGVSGSRHNEFKVKLSSRNSVYLIWKNMPFLQIILNLPFLVFGYLIKTLFFIKKGLGKTYVKGLMQGVKLSLSKEGRKRRVRFSCQHLWNYCVIQWELWKGMVLRFF